MNLPTSHTRIGRTGCPFRHQRGTKTHPDQAQKTIKADIMFNNMTKPGSPESAYQQFMKFWTRIALADQPVQTFQLIPLKDLMLGKRMALGKSDNHTLVP